MTRHEAAGRGDAAQLAHRGARRRGRARARASRCTASKASSGRSSAVTSRRRSTSCAGSRSARDVAQAGQRRAGGGAGTTRARSAAASARRASSSGRRSSSSHCARWRSCEPQRQHSASGRFQSSLKRSKPWSQSGQWTVLPRWRAVAARTRTASTQAAHAAAARRRRRGRASTVDGGAGRRPRAKRAADRARARPRAAARAVAPAARSPRATDVICTPSSPHGTTQPNGARSLSTLIAKPCVVTPRETCTPIEAILRSPAQTPVKSGPSSGRARAADAGVGERRDDRGSIVRR